MKGLQLDLITPVQDMLEQMSRDFGNQASGQTVSGFRQQPLEMMTGVLKLMEDPFNALSQAVEQSLEAMGMPKCAGFAFRCDDDVAGLLEYLRLSLVPPKSLCRQSPWHG